MKSRVVWSVLAIVILVLTWSTYAGQLLGPEEAKTWDAAIRGSALKIFTWPDNKVATGVFLREPNNDSLLILVTNKHVLLGSDSILLTVPVSDSSKRITDTLVARIRTYDQNDVANFVVPDSALDLAIALVNKRVISGRHKGHWSSLLTTWFRPLEELFPAQPVCFYGYPLGITVNGIEPLARTGVIAGIDTVQDIVYLDADAYGGSSGSPVYVNWTYPDNRRKIDDSWRPFVGIIAGNKPYRKALKNIETGNIEMLQYENSGIAIVVPAYAIGPLSEQALETLMHKLEEKK